MITQMFLKNRAEFPHAELMKHRGQCVAFSADGMRIVASGATWEELGADLDKLGDDGRDVVFDRLADGIEDDTYLGAGELM